MPFVLDASVTMAWCFADESTPYTRAILTMLLETYAEVPALWTFEIANVLAVNERRKRMATAVSQEFLRTLAGLDIRVEQTPPANANVLLSLARRHALTSYDAAYLELAMRKNLPLATFDKALIVAASQEGVALLRQS